MMFASSSAQLLLDILKIYFFESVSVKQPPVFLGMVCKARDMLVNYFVNLLLSPGTCRSFLATMLGSKGFQDNYFEVDLGKHLSGL